MVNTNNNRSREGYIPSPLCVAVKRSPLSEVDVAAAAEDDVVVVVAALVVVGVAEVVGAAFELVGVEGAAEEETGAATDEDTAEVEGAVDEENVGTSPPTFTGAEVVWTSAEVEATALDEGIAVLLLTKLLEVGFFALQRLTTRFLGTTVGVTATVSGTALLAVTA